MKSLVELFPQPLEVNKEGQRRSCLIREKFADGSVVEKELWFTYPIGLPMPKDDNCDSYLLAAFLPAMELKVDITAHGSISHELLANLSELQLVWNKWLPDTYSLIDINVKNIRENDVRLAGAITAFSGGVDAQFTAYTHATSKAGYRTQKLLAGVLVHGLDIPLSNTESFDTATKMASEVLNTLKIDLLPIKTNIRALWNVNWEHYFVAAVASIVCGLSKYAGAGLVGSSEPYEALITPWGSHPMTDPMLSSGAFKIIHDGAGFSRSEKIKVLAEFNIGMKNLRVCWEGESKDSNCGKCEKCVRTRLNLLLADVRNPRCFSTPLNKSLFKPIVLKNGFARTEWRLISDEIKSTNKGVEYLPEIEKVFKRKPKITLGSLLLPPTSQRRAFVKKLLKKA